MAQSGKSVHLALLRGINVGGANKLAKTDLIDLFAGAGCSDVRTFIQSGNVIFQATSSQVRGLSDRVSRQIEEHFGLRVPVVLRTKEELGGSIRRNPFLAAGAPEKTLHLYFLSNTPTGRDVATLDPDRSTPDAFQVLGREVYLRLPNGMARTKLTNAYFDSRLRTISTARNWNTVLQLYELMCG
ncbi:MAG: DUF1697 domain-containing protein [Acidobacteriaceae bacterium]